MSKRAIPSTRRLSVAEYLAEEIFYGRYRPGDFVPKEVDLAERFSINRAAVRSDLRQLVDAGVIERISGYGSKVREYEEWNILDPQVTDWIARYSYPSPRVQHEILAFRLDVEPYVAMAAAKRAKARDLVAIEEAFEGMGQYFHDAERPEEYRLHIDNDVAFHVAIFKATHNIVWSQLSHILRPSIQLLVAESINCATDSEEALERHRVLMECIRSRDANGAFIAAQAVLGGTAQALGIDSSDNLFWNAFSPSQHS